MQVDVLRDEGEAYAQKLEAAGVEVKLERYNGHFHAMMVSIPVMGQIAEDIIHDIAKFIHAQLG